RAGHPSALFWLIGAMAVYLGFFYVSGAAPAHWREMKSQADIAQKHAFAVTDRVRLGAGDTLAVAVMAVAILGRPLWLLVAIAAVGPFAIAVKVRRMILERPWEEEGGD